MACVLRSAFGLQGICACSNCLLYTSLVDLALETVGDISESLVQAGLWILIGDWLEKWSCTVAVAPVFLLGTSFGDFFEV